MSDKPTEATAAELLPSSLPKVRRGGVYRNGAWWVPMFCMSCSAESPYWVVDRQGGDAYYICPGPCAEKWEHEFSTKLVPDEVFWELCTQEQLAHEGRVLGEPEIVEALKQSDHYLSKLARSRP